MEEMQEENVVTATTDVDTSTTKNEEVEVEENTEQEETPKTFTQDQVNEMVKARLDRDRKSLFKRYGVEDRNALDDLIGKAQSYSVMEERYNAIQSEVNSLKESNLFLKNNINPERYDDVRTFFKGKELELNEENLANELSTHSEWITKSGEEVKPKTTIQFMGNESPKEKPSVNERDLAMEMFGLKRKR